MIPSWSYSYEMKGKNGMTGAIRTDLYSIEDAAELSPGLWSIYIYER